MPALTSNKAKKILKDGSVRGKPLTDKQKRLFGAKVGGSKLNLAAEAVRQATKS